MYSCLHEINYNYFLVEIDKPSNCKIQHGCYWYQESKIKKNNMEET